MTKTYVAKVTSVYRHSDPTVLRVKLNNGKIGKAIYAPEGRNLLAVSVADVKTVLGVTGEPTREQELAILREKRDLTHTVIGQLNKAIEADPKYFEYMPYVETKEAPEGAS